MMKYYFIFLWMFVFVVSCDYEEVPTYSGMDYVQFIVEKNSAQRKKYFNFVYSGSQAFQDTLWLKVHISGPVKPYNRAVRFKQMQEYKFQYNYDVNGSLIDSVLLIVPDQAVSGSHYVSFDDKTLQDKMYVPANELEAKIPVVLLRDPMLKEVEKRLYLQIVSSKDFVVGDQFAIETTIRIYDYLTEPTRWSSKVGVLGKYSRVLHQLYIDVTGKKWDDAFLESISMDMLYYYKNITKRELVRINEENGTPLLADPDDPRSVIVIP